VNSWTSLACYPRGSFYPVSHGLSTQYRGITKPVFRLCSTRWSHSQAPFCLYTLRLVSIQPEGTFGRLRYLLGGDRPSQTAHLARSPTRFHGVGLEPRYNQGGISLAAPPRLAPQFRSLPPILHRPNPNSMPSCRRQCSSCYTIRAGRNLPDKEFRYLRTVIVTAAVHRGFGSELCFWPKPWLTHPLNLPALGRCQPLYIAFRLCRDLWFW